MKDTPTDEREPPRAEEERPAGYEPPAFLWEDQRDLAAFALGCAKVNPLGGPPCDQGLAAS